ncbi:MAG: hypothetical protein ACRDQ1_15350 [Sciscionella sp.]
MLLPELIPLDRVPTVELMPVSRYAVQLVLPFVLALTQVLVPVRTDLELVLGMRVRRLELGDLDQ